MLILWLIVCVIWLIGLGCITFFFSDLFTTSGGIGPDFGIMIGLMIMFIWSSICIITGLAVGYFI